MDTRVIPLRITPDNLNDAYIKVGFSTEFNVRALEDVLSAQEFVKIPLSAASSLEKKYYFSDEKVKFTISEECIDINIVGSYQGWSYYQTRIAQLVEKLSAKVVFTSLTLKYRSIWPNLNIFDVIDGSLKLNRFGKRFQGTSLTFPAKWKPNSEKEISAVVVITENIEIDRELVSIIDIHLETNLSKRGDIQALLLALNEAHKAQKDMFFSLLDEMFVDSLNPVWPSDGI